LLFKKHTSPRPALYLPDIKGASVLADALVTCAKCDQYLPRRLIIGSIESPQPVQLSSGWINEPFDSGRLKEQAVKLTVRFFLACCAKLIAGFATSKVQGIPDLRLLY
jgi:hypothetical protein